MRLPAGRWSGLVREAAIEKFTTFEGVAAPMKMINVDTDMVIPKPIPEDHQAHRAR